MINNYKDLSEFVVNILNDKPSVFLSFLLISFSLMFRCSSAFNLNVHIEESNLNYMPFDSFVRFLRD